MSPPSCGRVLVSCRESIAPAWRTPGCLEGDVFGFVVEGEASQAVRLTDGLMSLTRWPPCVQAHDLPTWVNMRT